MKANHFVIAVALLLGGAPVVLAVSDGNYHPRRQHCSGHANNSDNPTYAEDGCLNYAFSISDYGGHEYFGWGSPQTPDHEETVPGVENPLFGTGTSSHQIAFWTDPGPDQGGCQFTRIDFKTQTSTMEPCPWFNPSAPNYYGPDPAPNPSSGFRLYNGADDNLAGGEHDSSEQMNNGSSDGGAIQLNLNLDPNALQAWAAQTPGGFLAHPLPIADAGGGACADGVCIAIQTTQRTQAYPTDQASQAIPSRNHGVADYGGFSFDPDSCQGGNDSPADCGGQKLVDWNSQNGDPTVDPGIQIFEDPDAQASPLGGPYPIPAIYVGTCGIVIGGGPIQFPPGPMINDAGQIVIDTGCHS